MSDAIRNAIIKLSIEMSVPSIKLPDLGPAIAQQNALTAAIEKSNAAANAPRNASPLPGSADGGSGGGGGPSSESIANTERLTAAIGGLESALRAASQAQATGSTTQAASNESTKAYGSLAEKAAMAAADLAAAEEKLAVARAKHESVRATHTTDSPEDVAARLTSITAVTDAIDKRNSAEDAASQTTLKLSAANLRVQAASDQFASSLVGVGKGLAYVAAGNSEALQKAVPFLLVVEGSYQAAKNLSTAHRALTAAQIALAGAEGTASASTGVLAAAMAALETAIAPILAPLAIIVSATFAAKLAYDAYTKSAREKAEATEKATAMDEGAAIALTHLNERAKIGSDVMLERISNLDTAVEKEMALEQVLRQRADAEEYVSQVRSNIASEKLGPQAAAGELEGALQKLEQQKSATEKLLSISKERADSEVNANRQLEERIGLQVKELEKAKELLRTEEDKSRALRAGIGALKTGERSRLDRAEQSAEAGTLTKKQAEDLKKFGGPAGDKIAEAFLEKFDQGIASKLESLSAKLREQQNKAFEGRTDVKNIDSQIATKDAKILELEDQNAQIIETQKKLQGDLLDSFRGLIDEMAGIKKEISLQKQSAAVSRAVKK